MDKAAQYAARILKYAYILILCATIGIVVFAYDSTYFYAKGLTVRADIAQIPLTLIAVVLLAVWIARTGRCIDRQAGRIEKPGKEYLLLTVCSLVLLALQAFVSYHAYFMSVGDDVSYVLNSAVGYSYGRPEWIEKEYLALNPNNIVLAWIYGSIRKGVMLILGMEPGMERFRVILILLQCLMNTTAGILVYRMVLRMHGGFRLAWTAWGCYAVLIGCSPYFLVPYSDGIALLFPLLLLELYAHVDNGRRGIAFYGAIGILSGLVYLIKPQAFIVMIAIVLAECLRFLQERKLRIVAGMAVMLCAMMLMTGPFLNGLAKEMQIDLSQEKSLGMTHYLNMGLNREREGAFFDEDRAMAVAQPTTKERDAYCLNSAISRVKSYGFFGMIDHSIRKCLANFADGAFAWGTVFNQQEQPLKDETVSAVVRSIVYEKGEHYHILKTIQQGLWIMVLLLCPFAAGDMKYIKAPEYRQRLAMMLSVMGIITFNMLFEAKARYIYVMVPIFILMAVLGVRRLLYYSQIRLNLREAKKGV